MIDRKAQFAFRDGARWQSSPALINNRRREQETRAIDEPLVSPLRGGKMKSV